jgi:Putative zinc-finger
VSTSAVETLIFRARRALREQLEGSLTCGEAEFAISRQLDGRLPRPERGQLRAHLRECPECSAFARRQRAQRGALKSLALVPLPGSLGSFFGGGGAAVGTGLALKAAAAVTAGLAIGGAGYEGVRHAPWQAPAPRAADAPVFQDVTVNANVPAPREHIPVSLVTRSNRTGAAKTHGAAVKQSGAKQHGNSARARATHGRALGHQKHYVGDASVASRHVHARQPTHPVRPVHPARSHKSTPKPKSKAATKSTQLPGPTDHGPPPGKKS